MNDVKDKVVIVTGGTAGVGEEAVKQLAENGAKVVFCARGEVAGLQAETELRKQGYDVTFVKADASVYEDNKNLVDATLKRYGRIDSIVCNAGKAFKKAFHELTCEDWDMAISTNLNSAFYLVRLALPTMLEQKSGSVVFISSGMVNCPLVEMSHYIASKAMLESLARCLSLDYCRYGIRFNTLCPGPIWTSAYDRIPKEAIDEILQTTPTGMMCKVEDVIKSLLFLVSDDSKIVYGAKITPDLADACGVRFD